MMREIIVFLYSNENDSSEGNYVDAEKKEENYLSNAREHQRRQNPVHRGVTLRGEERGHHSERREDGTCISISSRLWEPGGEYFPTASIFKQICIKETSAE